MKYKVKFQLFLILFFVSGSYFSQQDDRVIVVKKKDGTEQKARWLKDTIIRTPKEYGKAIETIVPENKFYLIKQGQIIESDFSYWCSSVDKNRHVVAKSFSILVNALAIDYILPISRGVDSQTKLVVFDSEDLNMNDNGSYITKHEIYLVPKDKIISETSNSKCPELNKIKTGGIFVGIYSFIN